MQKFKILLIGAHLGGGVATANNMIYEVFKNINNITLRRLDKNKYGIQNKYIKYIFLYLRCILIIISFRPDIIIAHVTEPLYEKKSFVLRLGCFKLKKKVKTFAHLHARPELKRISLHQLYTSQKYINGIICISKRSFQKLKFELKWTNKLLYLPNFINIETSNNKIQEISQRKYILYLGRMDELKGIFEIINIAKNFPNETFIFIGDFKSSDLATKDNFLSQVKDCNNIKWLGPMYSDKKYEYICNSKCLLLPSKFEVFPLTIIECGVFGVPSFTTPIGAIPEIIDNGINGVFIEPNSPEKNSKIIGDYLQNVDKLSYLSKNIMETCLKYYTLDANKNKLVDFIFN
jgi:glycosyltransferase involved in cell wall biosynthesis